jgi:hypothetical protein
MFKATLKRRATTLSKTLLTAGLLGGAALSTLGAGSAQAATGCGIKISWLAWIGGQNLTCGDKEFKWLSTAVPGDLPSSMVSAVQPLLEDYIFNLDKPFTSDPFDFTYEATITDPGYVFIAVDLDSDSDALASPPSVLEATYTFAGGNSPIMLTSTNGSSSVAPVTGGPTTITVNNRYDGSGGAIDTMENSFQQVPAPLPLLGVGAAFGSIRKLRKFSSQLKTFSMG